MRIPGSPKIEQRMIFYRKVLAKIPKWYIELYLKSIVKIYKDQWPVPGYVFCESTCDHDDGVSYLQLNYLGGRTSCWSKVK
jgi:hypothetical protein